jgi:hypothetical protein
MNLYLPLAAILLLQGCAITTHQLYDGIAAPRDLDEIDIYVMRVPNPDLVCRDMIRRSGASPMPWGLTFYPACSNLPFDHEIPEGERPWCTIVIWEQERENSWLVRHELEHCQGYRDVLIGTTYGDSRR